VADPLLRVENLVRRFGGIVATDNLSLDVASGELHAIIGPNGAGKTTLISQLTGQVLPNSGAIRFAGRDITRLPATVTRSVSGATPARKAACAWRRAGH
jgi:branched-chain amino acid transport system ATP-binding protein